jgi:hypothetical protein
MTGPLSPTAQQRLTELRRMGDRIQTVHGMVERFAVTRDASQAELLGLPMKRAFGRLKLELLGLGLDSMSQLAGAMEMAAGRSGSVQSKSRILREGVGSLRFQIDLQQRKVVQEGQEQRSHAEPPPQAGSQG